MMKNMLEIWLCASALGFIFGQLQLFLVALSVVLGALSCFSQSRDQIRVRLYGL